MLTQVVSFLTLAVLAVAEEVVERKVPPGAFIARQATNVGDPALWKEDFRYGDNCPVTDVDVVRVLIT